VDTQKREAEKKTLEQQRLAADAQKKADQLKKEQEAKRKADADKKAADEKQRQLDAEKKASEAKRKAEAEKKAQEDKKRKEDDAKKEDAKKKAEAEKARELLEHGDKNWMVQVALAANQANADAVVSKLRAKGYKVTTSPTSKGIRIMVGPSKDRDAADAARKKIVTDQSLNMKSAWVIDWVPLDQR
ncbi:SPOR domain-containing protein, partial [Acinetobacter soli]